MLTYVATIMYVCQGLYVQIVFTSVIFPLVTKMIHMQDIPEPILSM